MIYFFFNPERDEVKIGFCEDSRVFDRLAEVQTGCSCELMLLTCSMPGYRREEQQLHERFAHLRILGEWFRCEKELKEFLFDRLTMSRFERTKEQIEWESGRSFQEIQDEQVKAAYEQINPSTNNPA